MIQAKNAISGLDPPIHPTMHAKARVWMEVAIEIRQAESMLGVHSEVGGAHPLWQQGGFMIVRTKPDETGYGLCMRNGS